jgi:cytochrome d ubiquinol oxidase subunit I
MGAWQAGAFFVISVSAYYLLRKRHVEIAAGGIRIAVIVALVASVMQLVTGHSSASTVAETQPAKLAAFEGHFPASAPAGAYLFGWVDDEAEKVYGLEIPGLLSFLVHNDAEKPVTGLKAFPSEGRPPANLVFQSYHIMVAIGMLLIPLSLLGVYTLWRKTLGATRWLLWIFVFSVLLPQIANQMGWFTAEVGRQPWIVYGLLRTSESLSKSVDATQVVISLVMFMIIYLLLFALFIYLLNEKIKHGPDDATPAGEGLAS